MGKISISEIEKVAKLARIELNDTEQTQQTEEVGAILEFVETLQSVDTNDVTPTSQVTGLIDVWREDEIKKCPISPEELLSAAPNLQDCYVKVKKVL